MSTWLTARELAGLPGMPGTERRTRDKLAALGVPNRPRSGRGGGLEYDCRALPATTRSALMVAQLVEAGNAIHPAPEAPPLAVQAMPVSAPPNAAITTALRSPPNLADKAVADARLLLVNQVLELQGLQGVKRACALVALQLASGQASPELQAQARAANQRARTDAVSARTLERWLGQYRQDGWWGLLPAPSDNASTTSPIDADVAAVLGLFHSRDARWRKLSDATKHVTSQLGRPYDSWQALYSRARRALSKVDNVALIKSRHSGAQRAALLPYKKRDASMLQPLDVWLIDGHTFKAKVRHPDHGAPFAPELTVVIDAATRLICGWSVALSENVFAVGDALRHAVAQHGVPAIIYTDNGAGETAKQMDCPIHGFVARLGSDHRTGIPGHPQGHGLIERSWQTHAIRCAKQFGSYQGSDVDGGTYRRAAALLAKEQRALRRAEATGEVIQLSPHAPTWRQFIEAVEQSVRDYNHLHRHRGLAKVDGRHPTPAEAWAAKLDPELQHRPSELELRTLFMPALVRTARRGQVTLFNQEYQAPELMSRHVDGREVSVRYDIHNPHQVLIYTLGGEYVCEAKFAANRIDYFPKPVIALAREKRVAAAIKRREQQIDTALRELQGPAVTELAPTESVLLPQPHLPEVLLPTLGATLSPSLPDSSGDGAPAQAAAGRPFFEAPSDRYEWLMRHRDGWSDEDRRWLLQYVGSDDYEGLADYYTGRGLAWPDTGTLPGVKGAPGQAAT